MTDLYDLPAGYCPNCGGGACPCCTDDFDINEHSPRDEVAILLGVDPDSIPGEVVDAYLRELADLDAHEQAERSFDAGEWSDALIDEAHSGNVQRIVDRLCRMMEVNS